jgi:hypothetical protein
MIDRRAWTMAVTCALTSIVASAWVASLDVAIEEGKPRMHFGDLPPDIHDEYSYLFQAKTFLAGRLSFPSSPRMPELFDQMHVLNEGRFASRYFPGVGLWLAPFVALEHPYWAEWLAAALTVPLAIGLGLLFLYDYSITGNGFLSPYELYTNTYTPRHVYGFNNVVRGERNLGPKVLDNYDSWAENLTPRLAAENVGKRAAASTKWTLGPVPLAMAIIVFLLAALWQVDWRWRVVAGSVLSLHAVHVPYWLSGIMDWHYVFETGPLLLLIFAVTSQQLVKFWKHSQQVFMPAWWAALVASAVVTNWLPFDPFWSSRVDFGVQELTYARVKYEKVQRLIDQSVTKRPALLLIEADPADRHIDYVVNAPDLTAPVLRGRYRPGKTDMAKVHAAFPDRTLYLYRVQSGQIIQLSP